MRYHKKGLKGKMVVIGMGVGVVRDFTVLPQRHNPLHFTSKNVQTTFTNSDNPTLGISRLFYPKGEVNCLGMVWCDHWYDHPTGQPPIC